MSDITRINIDTDTPDSDIVEKPSPEGEYVRWADHAAIVQQLTDRNTVLAAEVRAWRHWEDMDKLVGTDDEVDVNANEAYGLLELARAATDAANAMEGA